MNLIKRSIYALIILLIVGVGAGFFYYDNLTFVAVLNSVFMVSLAYIMLGCLMFVARGGFFDAITLSFRRFMKKGTKYGDIMDDVERMELPSEVFEYKATEPLLISGIIAFLATVLISFNI
ncbi:DUF3899 domain-containing protein [Pseudalkalibacillus sp. Hm43]|uniref:DUF3899 domain-containing protein n=1 Tax=Pseudalkalibacillus sp. Hm43 TaxID=3450742 RepID=UPI003F433D82